MPEQQSAATQKAVENQDLRNSIQQPIDKAKAVNGQVLKAAEQQRKAIEDAGG